MALSAQTKEKLSQTLDAAVKNPRSDIPGVGFVAVNKDGTELFAHAAGKRGANTNENMTLDHVFWVASCTKMIIGIACMQLVEQRVLKLDDADQLEQLVPYLKDVKVLQDDGKLVEKEKRITLRMLLDHTAGFGYSFFNEKLRDYSFPLGYDEFSGSIKDIEQPLVNQPGSRWEYGISIDWAGIALERATGISLNDYLHKNIFDPLGLKNISMFPNESMKSRLVYMNARHPDGSLTSRDHLLRKPLIVDEEEKKHVLNSAGAGCYSTLPDYAQIISVLLNDGLHAPTKTRLLQPSSVEEMFKNSIPNLPDFGRQGLPTAKPELVNPVPNFYPVPGDPPQGWGLTFMISNGGATGRSKSTVWWAGIANLFWYADRENGVGGIIATHILPFGDPKVLGLWMAVEKGIYDALGKGN